LATLNKLRFPITTDCCCGNQTRVLGNYESTAFYKTDWCNGNHHLMIQSCKARKLASFICDISSNIFANKVIKKAHQKILFKD